MRCAVLFSNLCSLRHKMSVDGSDDDKYVCSDYGTIFKNQKRLHNHKRKPQTFDYPKCGNTFGDHGNKKRSLEICKEPEIGFDP